MTFKPGSYRSKYYEDHETETSPFASSFLDGGNFLDSARGYRADFNDTVGPVPMGEGVFDASGTKSILGGVLGEQQAEMEAATGALNAWADLKSARAMAQAKEDAASSQANASRTGSIIGAVGSIGGAVAGALI